MERLDSKLKMCCYPGSATEHAICTCDLATALRREKHVDKLFHLPLSSKQKLHIMPTSLMYSVLLSMPFARATLLQIYVEKSM